MEEDTLDSFMDFACECMTSDLFFSSEDSHPDNKVRFSKSIKVDLKNGDWMNYVRRDTFTNKPGHYEWVFISKRHRALVYKISDWGFTDISSRWIMRKDFLFQFDAVLDEES